MGAKVVGCCIGWIMLNAAQGMIACCTLCTFGRRKLTAMVPGGVGRKALQSYKKAAGLHRPVVHEVHEVR